MWGLLRATHALPSLAVTAFFSATAIAAGVGPRTALLAVAVLVGQFSIGWANDYLDAPLDVAAGRTDKPIPTGAVRRSVVGLAAAVALAADVPLSLSLGWRPGAAHLVAVGWAWMYDVALKWTVGSALPFAVSFGLVPVVVATMTPGARSTTSPGARSTALSGVRSTTLSGHPLPMATIVAAAACCGVAAHFANTLPDVAADAQTGVRGLPQRLGPRTSTLVAVAFLAAASVLLVVATRGAGLAIAAAVIDVGAATVVATRTRDRTQAFRLLIAAVAVLVVAFVITGGRHLTA